MAMAIPTEAMRERAAHWAMCLSGRDVSAAERHELQEWLLSDAQHEIEFRRHTAFIALARDFTPQIREQLERFAFAGSEASALAPWAPSAIAAGVLVAAMAAAWFFMNFGVVRTGAGETRTLRLADGSAVHLGASSQVRWLGGRHERRLVITKGEARFDIAQDASRPFHVVCQRSDIQVLATSFKVHCLQGGDTSVAVSRGMVAVREVGMVGREIGWPSQLSKNQRLSYGPSYPDHGYKLVDPDKGTVKLSNVPLANAFSELAELSGRSIVIANADRFGTAITGGTYQYADLPATFRKLKIISPRLRISESGDSYVVDFAPQ